MKAVAEFSFGRLMKMVLAWFGIPVALAASLMLPSGGPSADFLQAWFYVGLAILFLNASGLLTLRRRKLVRDDRAD